MTPPPHNARTVLIYIHIHYIIHIHTPPAPPPPPSRAFIHARRHRHHRRHRSPLFFRRVVKIDNFSHLPYRPTAHVDTPPQTHSTTDHPLAAATRLGYSSQPSRRRRRHQGRVSAAYPLSLPCTSIYIYVYEWSLSSSFPLISPLISLRPIPSLAVFLSQGVIICAVYMCSTSRTRGGKKGNPIPRPKQKGFSDQRRPASVRVISHRSLRWVRVRNNDRHDCTARPIRTYGYRYTMPIMHARTHPLQYTFIIEYIFIII